MLIKSCLQTSYPTVTENQSAVDAFEVMKASEIVVLPVLDSDKKCIGLISEKNVLSDLGVKQLKDFFDYKNPFSILVDASCLEGLQLIKKTVFDILPVTDENGLFVGIAAKQCMMEKLTESFNVEFPGTTMLLLVEQRDFVMYQLIRIIEQEHVQVLACGTSSVDDEPNLVRVSLKLNQYDTGKIQSALRRHGYLIESVSDKVLEEDLTNKADEFLHFLNL